MPATRSTSGDSENTTSKEWESDEANFNPKLAEFPRIEFGSGLFLGNEMIDITPKQIEGLVPSDADIFRRTGSEGKLTGAFASVRGKLDGPGLELFPGNLLENFGVYDDGKRHGVFRMWGAQQKRLLYSQYSKGAKVGITCVFRNGLPRYIELSDRSGVRDEFLVRFENRSQPKVIQKDDFTPADIQERDQARARLKVLEGNFAERERIYRKQFGEWWEGVKKQRAIAMGPGKRNAISARGKAVDAQNAAAMGNLLRSGASNAGVRVP